MAAAHRILVVDDETQITRVLRTALSAQHYDVRVANDGEMALEIMKDWAPQLVVTDLAMPNLDGVGLCKRIRQTSDIPIIVLSVRGQDRSKVEALDAGADDYVTKPFSTNELLARIRAHLRRVPAAEAPQSSIAVGDFHIDLESRLIKVAGREVHLTPKEFDLLHLLMSHPGKALTNNEILSSVWGAEYIGAFELVYVHVSWLRQKLAVDPRTQHFIQTIRGVGYRFAPEEP